MVQQSQLSFPRNVLARAMRKSLAEADTQEATLALRKWVITSIFLTVIGIGTGVGAHLLITFAGADLPYLIGAGAMASVSAATLPIGLFVTFVKIANAKRKKAEVKGKEVTAFEVYENLMSGNEMRLNTWRTWLSKRDYEHELNNQEGIAVTKRDFLEAVYSCTELVFEEGAVNEEQEKGLRLLADLPAFKENQITVEDTPLAFRLWVLRNVNPSAEFKETLLSASEFVSALEVEDLPKVKDFILQNETYEHLSRPFQLALLKSEGLTQEQQLAILRHQDLYKGLKVEDLYPSLYDALAKLNPNEAIDLPQTVALALLDLRKEGSSYTEGTRQALIAKHRKALTVAHTEAHSDCIYALDSYTELPRNVLSKMIELQQGTTLNNLEATRGFVSKLRGGQKTTWIQGALGSALSEEVATFLLEELSIQERNALPKNAYEQNAVAFAKVLKGSGELFGKIRDCYTEAFDTTLFEGLQETEEKELLKKLAKHFGTQTAFPAKFAERLGKDKKLFKKYARGFSKEDKLQILSTYRRAEFESYIQGKRLTSRLLVPIAKANPTGFQLALEEALKANETSVLQELVALVSAEEHSQAIVAAMMAVNSSTVTLNEQKNNVEEHGAYKKLGQALAIGGFLESSLGEAVTIVCNIASKGPRSAFVAGLLTAVQKPILVNAIAKKRAELNKLVNLTSEEAQALFALEVSVPNSLTDAQLKKLLNHRLIHERLPELSGKDRFCAKLLGFVQEIEKGSRCAIPKEQLNNVKAKLLGSFKSDIGRLGTALINEMEDGESFKKMVDIFGKVQNKNLWLRALNRYAQLLSKTQARAKSNEIKRKMAGCGSLLRALMNQQNSSRYIENRQQTDKFYKALCNKFLEFFPPKKEEEGFFSRLGNIFSSNVVEFYPKEG